MPLSPGTRLGRYEVVRLLGAGGMGEVYLAKDQHLDGKEVALKVLPAGALADEAARKRLRKEAIALSKVSHPNIAVVSDFDTQRDIDFLVMEYVRGQTLTQRLAAGALTEKEVSRLGSQIASALEEAHEQGVVHRDLKPGNVLVTPKGQAKVLDFGLAKMLRPVTTGTVTTETLSGTHGAAGTLPYMAPEQLRGETVDARTDIFALGAVLYEMATEKRAFREESSPRLTDAILHQTPVTPRAVNPRVSPELERIVLKCLQKGPENRYQSAKEIGVDLRLLGSADISGPLPPPAPRPRRTAWLVAGALLVIVAAVIGNQLWQPAQPDATPPSGKIMLAVLPLDNLSGDPEQEFFSDGMTDEMIAQLGRMAPQQLGVIARTSIMRFRNTERSIADIARDLQVDYILEGSVRRVGDTVRVTAQLIQASDQTQIWVDSYDREYLDVLDLQSEVARAIAEKIKIALTPQEAARLETIRSVDPEAHEAYLKGRYYLAKVTEEGFLKGKEYVERAIEMDPSHALAQAALASSYHELGFWGPLLRSEAYPKAKAAALKALEIDDTLGEAHTVLGMVAFEYEWDWLEAGREVKRGIELSPGDANAHHQYAIYLVHMGRFEEATVQIQQALLLDPLSRAINSDVAYVLYFEGKYDAAIEQYRKTLELEPTFVMTRGELGLVYAHKGMFEEAIAEVQQAVALSDSGTNIAYLGYVYGLSGKTVEAMKLLDQLKEMSNLRGGVPSQIAVIYGVLGDKDQAFEWLEKAFETRDSWLVSLKVYPWFDEIRSDPRFQDLVRRMRFPPD